MATRYGNFLRGIIGSILARRVNGKQVISRRTKPGTMKQTKATKNAANTFGMAAMLGSNIRQTFSTNIGRFDDPGMVNRMNSKLIETLNLCRSNDTLRYNFEEQSFNNLKGLDFNSESPLIKSLRIIPDVSLDNGILRVSAPAVSAPSKIKFPHWADNCDIIVSVALFRLGDGLKTYSTVNQNIGATKDLPYLDGLDFTFEIPNGCLCIAGLFLKYYSRINKRDVIMNSKKFSPAGICAALISPEKYEGKDKRQWTPMKLLKFDS